MALSKHTKRRNTKNQTATATVRRAFSTTNRKLDSPSVPSPLSPSPPSSRVALVPLRINLRRLPSRQFSSQSSQIPTPLTSHHPSPPSSPDEDAMMFSSKTFVKAGTKRKRSVSGTENATSTTGRVAPQRATRGTVPRGRFKRQKSESILGSSDSDEDLDETLSVSTKTADTNSGEEDEEVDLVDTDEDDDDEDNEDAETVGSAMEVDVDEIDGQDGWEVAESEYDSGGGDSSDEYYLNDASVKELLRLRKDALVRLYTCAGLSDDFDALTKHDLVEAIISARDDIMDLPPSSPSGCTSSDGSSDDGHFGGGEETDVSHRFRPAAANGLRRRVTVHNIVAQPNRNRTGRTISLGQLDKEQFDTKLNTAIAKYSNLGVRSKSSTARSSPSTSHPSSSLPSPPATRQRARKVSATQSSKNSKGKQVGFGQVEIVDVTGGDESDLTDLAELDEHTQASPSPRRLRSKGDKTQRKSGIDSSRKASFVQKLKARASEPVHQDEDEDLPDASDEDEDEDQLMPTPSKAGPSRSATRGRRTPVKSRLRPRPTQTHTPPSDGDDEEEEEEEETVEDDVEEGDAEEDRADLSDDDTEATPIKPRTLRNGKVVSPSEKSVGMEEAVDEDVSVDEDETANEETASVQSESTSDVEGEEDSDMEGEVGEESMDDFDLSVVTVKSLARLRRDDLVRLCEARDLDTSGKKAQLARALIKWRDHPAPESSCPSSTGTVRPHGRSSRSRGSKGKAETHVHPPQTPPVSNPRDTDPDVDLDLGSLGLHDREIPPDNITKLSKIGSGGFKDVFIGKLKSRKVAIAEFRGQLNAMDIKELKLLGDFNHPNIVRFMGVSIPINTRETPVMIISELCSNGDLFDYLRASQVPAVRRMVCMMLDIARGVQYLHNHKPSVIHRDCKSSNILITSKGVAKITDFGLAKVKQSTRSMVRSLVGTVNWQAPELWHPQPKYNFKVDVFSCAMVYWEMFQWHLPDPKYPWEGMNEHAIYDIVGAKRQRPSTEGLKRQWRPELVDLMEHMWAHDPAERPTMDEVAAELEEIFNRL